MKTRLFILSALAASSMAVAQEPANKPPVSNPGSQHSFETLDKNADGRISVAEAQADSSLAAKFSMLDKDGKGYITRQQYDTHARGERK